MKSDNLIQMDALWREYVNTDPDLRRLELRKQAIAHRRIRQAHARRIRQEAGQAILQTLADLAGKVAVAILFVLLFVLMIQLA